MVSLLYYFCSPQSGSDRFKCVASNFFISPGFLHVPIARGTRVLFLQPQRTFKGYGQFDAVFKRQICISPRVASLPLTQESCLEKIPRLGLAAPI